MDRCFPVVTYHRMCRVLAVDPGVLHVQPLGQPEETLPFGTCVWATGVGMHPLVSEPKGGARQ